MSSDKRLLYQKEIRRHAFLLIQLHSCSSGQKRFKASGPYLFNVLSANGQQDGECEVNGNAHILQRE